MTKVDLEMIAIIKIEGNEEVGKKSSNNKSIY